MTHILYLGWIGYGNLGDDLMWDIFKKLCGRYLGKNKYKITPSFPGTDINSIDLYDIVVLGGGSLLQQIDYINILYNAMKKNKKIIIWGSGIDRIGKLQMELLIAEKKENLLNPEVRDKLAEIIENADFAGVRGPLTYEVLKQSGINAQKIQISGDPGLLLEADNSEQKTGEKIWDAHKKVIGLNWGTANDKIYGNNELQVENQIISAAKKLIQKGCKIYMFIMWSKDKTPSMRLFEKLDDNVNAVIDTNVYHQSDLLEIIRNFNFTINFKLHASVISAAADIPFIALGYRFKVFDFAKSMDLEDHVIPTDSLDIEQRILDMNKYILKNKNDILKKYTEHKQIYKKITIIPFLEKI